MINAVDAAYAVLDVPDADVADAALPGFEREASVVGVQRGRPAESRALRLRHTDEAQKRLTHVQVASLGIADPGAVVDRFADCLVDALTLTQLFLDLFAGRDVAHVRDDA